MSGNRILSRGTLQILESPVIYIKIERGEGQNDVSRLLEYQPAATRNLIIRVVLGPRTTRA